MKLQYKCVIDYLNFFNLSQCLNFFSVSLKACITFMFNFHVLAVHKRSLGGKLFMSSLFT